MFKFLCMKAPKASKAPSPYRECRSWNGTAYHIRDTRDESGLALCGYEPLDDRSHLTLMEYHERLPHQHEGWHYCKDCGEAFEASFHG